MNESIPLDFARDFKALVRDQQPIVLEISKYHAWCIMSAIQLASKHPEGAATAPMRDAILIARNLQEALATTPALTTVAEGGWES